MKAVMQLVDDDEVVIHRDELQELIDDAKFLECLNMAGVDNWEGYEIAQEFMDGDRELDD